MTFAQFKAAADKTDVERDQAGNRLPRRAQRRQSR